MPPIRCLIAALAAGALLARAEGTITVEKVGGELAGLEEATVALNPITGGWDITLSALYAPAGETIYIIRGDGGEIIDNVFIDVPCWQGPGGGCVPAGSPVFVHVLSAAPGGIRTIHNVLQRGDAETFLLDVQATEDIGSVQAEIIGTVVAGRDITGPIVSTTGDHNARGVFWIEAQRDLLGDVLVPNGRIGRIWAYRNIGSAVDPVRIEAKYDINGFFAAPGACVQQWIAGNAITCAGDVYADIDTGVNAGPGRIFRFLAGSFHGSLATRTVMADVATGTPGSIAVTEVCTADILMRRSFANPLQWLELPPDGFSGQVIVNADGIFGGQWTSPVYLGPASSPARVLVLGPQYTQSAAALGGGSIGLVPFALHGAASTPPDGGSTTPGTPEDPLVVRLRHYGPVVFDGPAPIMIERRSAGGGSWLSLSLVGFDVSGDPADARSVRIGSALGGAGFQSGYEYRIVATDQMRCAVTGSPAVAWNADYRFTVHAGATCAEDLTSDGTVTMADLLVVIALWGPAPGSPGDLDGDGCVGFSDLLRLIAAWGPCD